VDHAQALGVCGPARARGLWHRSDSLAPHGGRCQERSRVRGVQSEAKCSPRARSGAGCGRQGGVRVPARRRRTPTPLPRPLDVRPRGPPGKLSGRPPDGTLFRQPGEAGDAEGSCNPSRAPETGAQR
jgi:hypothetical protein